MSEHIKGFHDVTLFANNLTTLRDFYSKLGFRQVLSTRDVLVVFAVGNNELAIHTASAEPKGVVGLTFLVEELDALQRKLTDCGIAFEGPTLVRPGLHGVTFQDPNGNRLAFLQRAT